MFTILIITLIVIIIIALLVSILGVALAPLIFIASDLLLMICVMYVFVKLIGLLKKLFKHKKG